LRKFVFKYNALARAYHDVRYGTEDKDSI